MTQQVMASVIASRALNDSVWEYTLKPEHFVAYEAGQYVQLHFAEGDYFFSIANAPLGADYYQLHIRHPRDQDKNQALMAHLAVYQQVALSLPFGRCDLSQLDPVKPILFLAAGTGYAPIRAIIEQLIAQDDTRQFELYWGVHVAEDFYDMATIQRWQASLPELYFCAHVTHLSHDSLISKALQQHPQDLHNWQIVMAGPFELMYTIRDALLMVGMAREVLFSDAFEFE